MSNVNSLQFIKTLKLINVDLSQFDDLSFDGLCSDPSLQVYLNWFCSSFDENCVLSEEEEADYNALKKNDSGDVVDCPDSGVMDDVEAEAIESLKDTVTLLKSRLEKAQANLSLCVDHEEKLLQEEKVAVHNLNKARRDLFEFESTFDCKKTVLSTTDCALSTCISGRISLPDFESWHRTLEQNGHALSDFHTKFISAVENSLLEDEKAQQPEIENLESLLVQACCELRDIDSKLSSRNIPETNEDVIADVRSMLFENEAIQLRRKVDSYNFLISALKLEFETLLQHFTEISFERGLLLHLKKGSNEITELTSRFVNEIADTVNMIEDINKGIKERVQSTLVDKLDTDIDRKNSDLTMDEEKPSALCRVYMKESSLAKVQLHRSLKNRIASNLNRLRCGPSLKITPVSSEIFYLLNECRFQREKMEKEIKELTKGYVNMKEPLKRRENLLWMYFLSDSARFRAFLNQESILSAPTPSVNRNRSFFDVSQWSNSNVSFFHK